MRYSLCFLLPRILLSCAVVLCNVLPAHAADGGYPYADMHGPGTSPSGYTWTDAQGRRYSPYGYVYRNCTDYVAWKVVSLGVPATTIKGLGHAGQWADVAAKRNLSVSDKPSIWSVAVQTSGGYGHVAFVEEVYADGTITVSEYNVTPGTFGVRTGTPASLGFSKFIAFGITPPKVTVQSIKKTIGPDGAQQLYTATKDAVYESWWHQGGDGVYQDKLFEPGGVKDIAKLSLPDGTQTLYTAVEDGIWETWWRPGMSPQHSQIITLQNTRKVLAQFEADGTHTLYVLAADGPYEYWWRDGGDGIHKQRLALISDPIAFFVGTGPDGTKQLYTATAGAVFESWWHPGLSVHTEPVISISQNNIVDLAKLTRSDGTQLLYSATTNGVWETSWQPAGGLKQARIVATTGIRHIQAHLRPDWSALLYVGTAAAVQEYTWLPWQPIHSGQLVNQADITAIDSHTDGTAGQLYTASGSKVYETWWGDGSLHQTTLLHVE